MRVVYPYYPTPNERVVESIERQDYQPIEIRCVNKVGDPDSYPKILARHLLSGEDVCIVEHDVESRPGFLYDLEACPEPWCFFAYDFRVSFEDALGGNAQIGKLGNQFAPLGHTRFKAGACEPIRELLTSTLFSATWVARDVPIMLGLVEAGLTAHRHPGKAIHHHDYSEPSPMGSSMGDAP